MQTPVTVTMPTPLPVAPSHPWDAWEIKLKFAQALVSTGFCPAAIKTPAQALAVILAGQELGIPPMHALRSIHVIQGKVTLSAELMLALMLKGGVKLTWQASSDAEARLVGERGATAFAGIFTLEDAKRAGLLGKDGWRNYPAAMLRARVIALVARVVAPDLIAGMYTAEELGADVDAEGTIIAPPDVLHPEAEIEPESGRLELPAKVPVSEWVQSFQVASTLAAGRAVWAAVQDPQTWHQYTTDEQTLMIDAKNAMKERLGGAA